MAGKMSREELVDLVKEIMTIREKGTGRKLSEKEHHSKVVQFQENIDHPGGSDLIYYPDMVGLPENATAEEIVDLALKGPAK